MNMSGGHKNTGGGIQRLKLEVHGKGHKIVGMISYIQSGTYLKWQEAIKNCIDGLCWAEDEYINTIEHNENTYQVNHFIREKRSLILQFIICG